MKSPLKIAVVGCGAVGSFYGAKLCRAGHNTHFLLRSDFSVVRARGVEIQSVEGDFQVRPGCADRPEAIGVSDVVLIGLKTTANDQFARLLPPLVGPETLIVTLQNGLGNEEALEALFGPNNILCGLCFVCLNRSAPGIIRHLAHGRIVLGEYKRPAAPRTRMLAESFGQAGISCKVTENLEQAHWEKLVWNVPFNGLGVAGAVGYEALKLGHVPPGTVLGHCLPTDALLGDPRWKELVIELMFEIIRTARALGYPLQDEAAEINVSRTYVMGAYQASTLLDFENGLPIELESLFLAPWRRAQAAGIATPRLAALCAVLTELSQAQRTAPGA